MLGWSYFQGLFRRCDIVRAVQEQAAKEAAAAAAKEAWEANFKDCPQAAKDLNAAVAAAVAKTKKVC